MTERLFVVLPGAGRSVRFGDGETPKQYRPLAGRRVVEWSILALAALSPAAIVLVVAADDRDWLELPAGLRAQLRVVVGGADRAASVRAGLAAVAELAAPDDWAVVHDVARPLLATEDARALLTALAGHPVGGLLAAPVVDTVKRAGATGEVAETLPRDGLWLAQTPQAFRYGVLCAALDAARSAGVTVTDEAQAIEHLGGRPLLVAPQHANFKLTWPGDLARAAAELGQRGRYAQVAP